MKNNRLGWAIITSLCVLLIIVGFPAITNTGSAFNIEVFPVGSDGYGYKIRKDKQVVIVQPFIPAISGKRSFKTRSDAECAGKLVLKRLETGQDFSLSKNDLTQMNIRFE